MLKGEGMTLIEVVVGLAILGILAAAIYPTVMGRMHRAQAAALANQLSAYKEALAAYRENVGRYPNRLRRLTAQPAPGTRDLCLTVVPGGLLAGWRGPYLNRGIDTDSIRVGDASVLDTLFRDPVSGAGQPGTLRILAVNVDSAAAAELERGLDGSVNYSAGNLMWFPSLFGLTGLLVYNVPIRGC